MQDYSLSAFAAYFRQLAGEHVELKSYVHGAAGRIISGSRSGIEYPCLWLETPTLALNEKDNVTAPDGRRRSAFVVLLSVPAGDYQAQDAGWERGEAIALDVVARMREDRRARRFRFFMADSLLEPVATISVANEIGWRMEFDLETSVDIRYDATRWQQTN